MECVTSTDVCPRPRQSCKQHVLQVLARERIERREGLVHEQQVGVEGECPSDSKALPHPARELSGIRVGEVGKTHLLETGVRSFLDLALVELAYLQTERRVVKDRLPREEPEVLEDQRRARAGTVGH